MKYGDVFNIAMVLVILVVIAALAAPGSATNVSNIMSTIVKGMTGTPVLANGGTSIPEFPALGIPVATTIGLMLLFQHKKLKQKK